MECCCVGGWFDAYVRPLCVDSICRSADGHDAQPGRPRPVSRLSSRQPPTAAAAFRRGRDRRVAAAARAVIAAAAGRGRGCRSPAQDRAALVRRLRLVAHARARPGQLQGMTDHLPPPPSMPCAHAAHNERRLARRLWTPSVAASSSDRDSSARFGSRDPTYWRYSPHELACRAMCHVPCAHALCVSCVVCSVVLLYSSCVVGA